MVSNGGQVPTANRKEKITYNMTRKILFIQGGGDEGYEADKALVNSLKEYLGQKYNIDYPKLETNDSLPDFGWTQQIEEKVLQTEENVFIVGHSLGASMLLKYLSEKSFSKKIKGIFLVSTPFWSGNEDWKTGLKLQDNFSEKLPGELPIFFYHCKDDEVAPISHLDQYKQKITRATFREIKCGGHQLSNDLTVVGEDISLLS